jgi:predicted O-methyltransferase YrrM
MKEVDERWTAVDDYLAERLTGEDPTLEAALRDSEKAGLPAIQVTPTQGKLLQLLARAQRAKAILEMGTLGGYSTIWLARALEPGGRLVTLESEASHADVARANLARAGVLELVDLRLGKALDTLPRLATEATRFDFVFIDADKPNIPEYFTWAIRLSRPGALIVVDNVVREGKVADANSEDANVQGVRRFFQQIDGETRVSATAIQTVGGKGYDGFALALVLGDS